ncbi:hypothetical protein [Streptomyces lichenis]|uniref:Uncharacterized protein n=1 Tax=Streptomyces lichenis TaxID=2306967 RepID=A0ABT0ID93_9ACTN|nr:hypothetical protein [Streptomyces lichenis]MCK8679275.1 hypothetical protein [Streptomyces lichenis]
MTDSAEPGGAAGDSLRDFRPSHVVPADGLPAWEAPDPARPTVPLDPFLPVRLVDRVGDWGQVLCSNGWAAWVDGRLLVAVPSAPPVAGRPMGTADDPRPLLARTEEELGRYRRAVEDLAAGRSDGEMFARRTEGLRFGLVASGGALWVFDTGQDRWLYCDGAGLSPYATADAPSAEARPGRPDQPEPRASERPAAAGTGSKGAPEQGARPAPEPTRLVTPDELPGAPPPATEQTRVVDPGELPATPPDGTRVVDPDELPTAPPAADAERTRVVDPDDLPPAAERQGPQRTRVVDPDELRTRAVAEPPVPPDRGPGGPVEER